MSYRYSFVLCLSFHLLSWVFRPVCFILLKFAPRWQEKRCAWCGDTGNLQPLKVSPKKSKLACPMCYKMMQNEKPKLMPEIGDQVIINKGYPREGNVGTIESFDFVWGLSTHLWRVSFDDGSGSGYYSEDKFTRI